MSASLDVRIGQKDILGAHICLDSLGKVNGVHASGQGHDLGALVVFLMQYLLRHGVVRREGAASIIFPKLARIRARWFLSKVWQ